MLYYIIIALQIYCAYHAYTTKNNMYWYFVIFFAPGLGSLIYLITQVFTKRDVAVVQKEVVSIINPTKKVKDLEKKVAFADTFQNRLDLADAYLEIKDFENAIRYYNEALKGHHGSDFYGNTKLLEAYYNTNDYNKVIATAILIENHPDFEKSKSQLYYGLAIAETGDTNKAAQVLNKINKRYSNYPERLLLATFLKDHGKIEEATELVEELLNEGANLTKPNQRKYRTTFLEIKKLKKELQTNS